MVNDSKILFGVKSICEYLNGINPKTLKTFIELGLPHEIINGRVYAHTDNIDIFFKKLTAKRRNPDPGELESNGGLDK